MAFHPGRWGCLGPRRLRGWVAGGLVAGVLLAGPPSAWAAPPPPVLHGRAAAVVDAATGQVLWSANGHERLPMASTTKMMTALVALALEGGRTGATMVVPPEVRQAYGQMLGLRPGDRYTFLQLLEGMLLYSANDAAVAIAVDSAGSEAAFVRRMNQEARALGLTDTHFANPDGLDDPDQYSCAVDLARLAVAVLRQPLLRAVVRMPSAVLPWPERHTTRVVDNIDTLLTLYPGAIGVKTGYTSEAANVAVGAAERGGQIVVGVVMGEPAGTLWSDEMAVLDYGFALLAQGAPEVPAGPGPRVVQAMVLPAVPGGVAAPVGAATPRQPLVVPAGTARGGWPWRGALGAGAAVLGLVALVRLRRRRRGSRRLGSVATGRALRGPL